VRYILINIGLYSYLLTTVRAPRDSIRTPSSVTYSTPKVFTPVGPHDFDQSDEYISATVTAEECMAWEPSLESADIHVTYHGVDQPGRVYLTRGFDTLPPTSSRDILAPKRGHYCPVFPTGRAGLQLGQMRPFDFRNCVGRRFASLGHNCG